MNELNFIHSTIIQLNTLLPQFHKELEEAGKWVPRENRLVSIESTRVVLPKETLEISKKFYDLVTEHKSIILQLCEFNISLHILLEDMDDIGQEDQNNFGKLIELCTTLQKIVGLIPTFLSRFDDLVVELDTNSYFWLKILNYSLMVPKHNIIFDTYNFIDNSNTIDPLQVEKLNHSLKTFSYTIVSLMSAAMTILLFF